MRLAEAVSIAVLLIASTVAGVGTVQAGAAAEEMILPPERPWSGNSRSLIAPADDPWITPSEQSDLTRTPRYDETVAWLRLLVEAAPELEMVSIGRSDEGRDIWMVIASREKRFTAAALRASKRPLVLAQAGIHSGEIDGKDAGLMLLRDLTVRGTKCELLDGVNFLFVPILSVDGHERMSKFSRINQRGPVESGWRVNSRRLNLNRDYAKLDTPEIRAMIGALGEYRPDLYVDLHVTDGIDYQYDVTFGYTGPQGHSPAIAGWLDRHLAPGLLRDLEEMGHIPGPLMFGRDRTDPDQGLVEWTPGPRFSTGYGDLRHLPSVLLENHSLKPYDQRVLGAYVFLESILRTLAAHGAELREAVAEDRQRRPPELPLTFGWDSDTESHRPFRMLSRDFLMVEHRLVPSPISGAPRLEYTGVPVTKTLPYFVATKPGITVTRPRAYWIPPAWGDVIERLRMHGIRMETIDEAREIQVEMYRIEDAKIEPEPYEGHARVSGTPRAETRIIRFVAGSVRVPTDQPLGDLAIHLLEPVAPDSFFSWGFFLEPLQRVEYVEGYVMEPMAEKMLQEDAELKRQFEELIANDEEFANDPRRRLQWFYEKTPYYDHDWNVYPVAREI
jgi:murein tripeptide amidase MpaA